MHKIQRAILKKLLFSEVLRYADLKPYEMEGSQFTFHLDSLIAEDWVRKVSKGRYALTASGKEYANRMYTKTAQIRPQAKVTTVMCCINTTAEPREYLLYTRKKNPFYGCQGFPTEKVWYGEDIAVAVSRGLQEETGLIGKPELIAVRHYKVYSKERELLEDKLMFIFKFINPEGKLKGNEEGAFRWIKETEIKKYVRKPLEEFKELFTLLKANNKGVSFSEKEHITDKF